MDNRSTSGDILVFCLSVGVVFFSSDRSVVSFDALHLALFDISIVDISTLLKNIDIDIDIDMVIFENIDINKGILQNIDIDEIMYI